MLGSEYDEIRKEISSDLFMEHYLKYDLYSGIHQKYNRRVFVKVFTDIFNVLYGPKKILNELYIYSQLNHENLTNLINLKYHSHSNQSDSIIITLESSDTTLYDVIDSKQELTEDHHRYFIYQILRALKYLHSANIVHKNLNPRNIMLDSNCDLKLGTFDFEDFKHYKERNFNCWYLSPEQLLLSHDASFSADIWSVGCIFYEIIMMKPLFTESLILDQLKMIVQKIGSPAEDDLYFIMNQTVKSFLDELGTVKKTDFKELIPKASQNEVDLIEKMLVWNPSKRISVDEALKHPYFECLHDSSDEPTRSPIEPLNINFNEDDSEMRKCVEYEIKKICKNFKNEVGS